MSGLGAPLRMPMPTPTRLMGVPSPPSRLPFLAQLGDAFHGHDHDVEGLARVNFLFQRGRRTVLHRDRVPDRMLALREQIFDHGLDAVRGQHAHFGRLRRHSLRKQKNTCQRDCSN